NRLAGSPDASIAGEVVGRGLEAASLLPRPPRDADGRAFAFEQRLEAGGNAEAEFVLIDRDAVGRLLWDGARESVAGGARRPIRVVPRVEADATAGEGLGGGVGSGVASSR